MTTKTAIKRESNAQVKSTPDRLAVRVTPERVLLSLSLPLSNGKWEEYPKVYSVWSQRTPDLYQKVQALKDSQEVWVEWTDKPATKEGTFYHDITAMGRPRGQPPQSPAPQETPGPEEEPFPIPEAARPGQPKPALHPASTPPSETPERHPTAPKPSGARKEATGGPNGWREAWSQSREAQEARERGIARSVALQETRALVEALLVFSDGKTDEERLAFIETTWPRLARRAMATLKELGG